MIPRTLSASSLQVWALCPSRWVAEYMNRGAGFSNVAADTGTAFHGGAERYVQAVYIDKTLQPSLDLLITFYMMSYVETFKTTDTETDAYKDGLDMTKKWFKRTSFDHVKKVETVEVKRTIKVPYNHPDGLSHQLCENCEHLEKPDGRCFVNFNYIMDRVDQLQELEWEVVDYKTIRVPIQPEDLKNKLQARAYALAIQIEHPQAQSIKVTFDLIRHEPVSFWFTRDDNIKFWNFLCDETQRIVDTEISKVRPVLNMECGYCVQKFTCPLMQSNIAEGGIHSLDMDQKVKLKADLDAQMKANKSIVEALEESLMLYAFENDVIDWVAADGSTVQIGSSRRRAFDAKRAAEIMGPELFSSMAGMTLGNLQKIIDDESLDANMRKELKSLIGYQNGNLSVKVKPPAKNF